MPEDDESIQNADNESLGSTNDDDGEVETETDVQTFLFETLQSPLKETKASVYRMLNTGSVKAEGRSLLESSEAIVKCRKEKEMKHNCKKKQNNAARELALEHVAQLDTMLDKFINATHSHDCHKQHFPWKDDTLAIVSGNENLSESQLNRIIEKVMADVWDINLQFNGQPHVSQQ